MISAYSKNTKPSIEPLRITEEGLRFYIQVASCVSTPICLVDQKGFIHYMNEDFKSLIDIPVSSNFPFIGRFMENRSSVKIRKILNILSESEDRQVVTFATMWDAACLKDESASNYMWTIAGYKDNPVFTICGR